MVTVAIADPLPVYRAGVAAEMRASGHIVEAPDDVVAWAVRVSSAVLLLTLESDTDWVLLAEIGQRRVPVAVVALVTGDETSAGIRAIRAGAQSVLRRDTSVDSMRRTVEAAADGMATVPVDVLHGLRTGSATSGPPPGLSVRELTWLRELATRTTVSALAAQAGYSERAMYRLLKETYGRLGTDNRTDALLRAQAQGWLTAT
jgi:DNA-binding NarL/FixJ family response regulator